MIYRYTSQGGWGESWTFLGRLKKRFIDLYLKDICTYMTFRRRNYYRKSWKKVALSSLRVNGSLSVLIVYYSQVLFVSAGAGSFRKRAPGVHYCDVYQVSAASTSTRMHYTIYIRSCIVAYLAAISFLRRGQYLSMSSGNIGTGYRL